MDHRNIKIDHEFYTEEYDYYVEANGTVYASKHTVAMNMDAETAELMCIKF